MIAIFYSGLDLISRESSYVEQKAVRLSFYDHISDTSALFGNDLATLPAFPAEIRAPQGTIAGVSSFQVQIADFDILTPGDNPDVLVAMNPAALKAHLHDLAPNGMLILNEDAFEEKSKRYRLVKMELLQTIKRSKIRFDLTDSTIPTRLPKEVKDLLYDIADVAMYIKAYKEIGGDHEALPFGRIKRDEVLKAKAALDELSRKVKQKDKLRWKHIKYRCRHKLFIHF